MVHYRLVGIKPRIADNHMSAKTNAFAANRLLFRLMLLPTTCGSASEHARGKSKELPFTPPRGHYCAAI